MRSCNIVFPAPEHVEVRDEPVDEPGPGQVRIRTQHSLLSIGTELTCLTGAFEAGSRWTAWVEYPHYPGYSNIGVITDVGPGVTQWQPGDRVATRGPHCQYTLFPDLLTPEQQAEPRSQSYFTWAEVNERMPMVRVPERVDGASAAWFGLGCIAQIGVRRAAPQLGEDVAVIGLGPLGQLVVRYSALLGARRIIAIDTSEARLEAAQRGGATHTLAMSASEALAPVHDITGGALASVVYDVTGNPAVLDDALRLARRLGKVVLLGDAAFPSQQRLGSDLLGKGLTIVGVHDLLRPATPTPYEPWTHARMGELFFEYLADGRLAVADLITRQCTPDEAPAVYRGLREARSDEIGVLIDWASSSISDT